jgi:hypothetical protein
MRSWLVIIHDRHFVGAVIGPLEDYAPLVIDSNRMESVQPATQLFQPVGRGHAEVVQPRRGVDRFELPLGTRREPFKGPDDLIVKQTLRSVISKGSYQSVIYRIPGCGGSTDGAMTLRVSRPTLYSLLNAKADLSGDMARFLRRRLAALQRSSIRRLQ